ncbi:YheV family putative zinc ribbon protein [Neptunicella marina]|uniref:YheV family putative metal-binding protein n=1 Tax=Neptunicella marina TaxID=2125989 RepID=A0A8J6IUN2_9ALTE|nr:YheV family putative zinc ribbon protein [Neptunicella marina]MBC3765941.1 YheV family putative metal-binding protein [Neptunicella marina]
MSNRIKKRFIAGAVCPKCKAQDSIMLFFQDNIEQLECVQCGYHESQPQEQVKKASREQEQVIGVFKP